jgi:hypothetical protein
MVAVGDVSRSVLPEKIWSLATVVSARADGFVAYTLVITVIRPGSAGLSVQLTVT